MLRRVRFALPLLLAAWAGVGCSSAPPPADPGDSGQGREFTESPKLRSRAPVDPSVGRERTD